MFTPAEFDAIRAYEDRDLGATIKNLFADEAFRSVLQSLFPNQSLPLLEKQLSSYTSILEFQKNFIHGLVRQWVNLRHLCANKQGVTLYLYLQSSGYYLRFCSVGHSAD